MAGNVLTATIKIDDSNVKQAFDNTASSAASAAKAINSIDLSAVEAELDRLGKTGQLSIGAIEASIKQFQAILKTSTNPSDVNKLNTAIASLQNRANQLKLSGGVGFDDFRQKANAANIATQNLGRVLQDLPFGFIGIANNLNPLLESFQRLKAETGSVGGAIKALGSSLLGAGGLGLALSGVTAALSFASIGMTFWGDKLFGASEASKAAAEKAKELKDAIEGAFESTAQEASRVTALTAILQNETETRKRRLAAIKELKDIQPEIFKGLKLEGDAVIGLNSAYEQYLKTLPTVIAAKIKQVQLEQKITELLHLQGVTLTESEKVFANFGKNLAKSLQAQNDSLAKLGKGEAINLFSESIKKGQEKVSSAIKTTQKDIDALIKDLIELSPGIKVNFDKEKAVKAFEPIIVGIVQGLNDVVQLIELNPHKLSLPFQLALDAEKLTIQFSNVKRELEDALNEFALKQSSVPIVLQQQILVDPNLKLPPDIRQQMERHIQAQFRSGTPLKFEVDAEGQVHFKIDKQKAADEINRQIVDIISNIEVEAFATLGRAIGEALAGGRIEDAFKQFASVLADGIENIGEKLIALGLLGLKIDLAIKSLASNPALAIAIGVALVALSQGLKAGLSKREKGGPVNKGQLYEVNERGREIFQSNSGKSYVIQGSRQLFTPPVSGKIINHFETEKILKNNSSIKNFNTKSITNKISGYRSAGGNVVAGNTYVVNEAGREIFVPSIGGKINTAQPSGLVHTANFNGNLTGQIKIAGKDLIAVLANAGRSQGRLT